MLIQVLEQRGLANGALLMAANNHTALPEQNNGWQAIHLRIAQAKLSDCKGSHLVCTDSLYHVDDIISYNLLINALM